MKRFILTLTAIFICTIAYAHTINWHVGDTILETTTCDSGDSITPPTAPYKYGYHFVEWAEYIPIEYLESTGTQWIDTRVIPNNNTGMIIDYYATRSEKPRIAYIRENSFYFGISENSTEINANINIMRGTQIIRVGSLYGAGTGRYKINIDKTNVSITSPDNSITTVTFDSSQIQHQYNYSLLLFTSNLDGNIVINDTANIKIYSCKFYDNNVLVRDFIPVLDKNGVPCMYDKVEKKFYYNAGTGQFVAGPVIGE